eukprot:427742-Prorocentrum_minimum.AAC.3
MHGGSRECVTRVLFRRRICPCSISCNVLCNALCNGRRPCAPASSQAPLRWTEIDRYRPRSTEMD